MTLMMIRTRRVRVQRSRVHLPIVRRVRDECLAVLIIVQRFLFCILLFVSRFLACFVMLLCSYVNTVCIYLMASKGGLRYGTVCPVPAVFL